MQVRDVARITGVTVRTLHYYDEIGLLPPSRVTPAGYREYDEKALAALQEILFFRELHFSLADIRRIMADPRYDRAEALRRHRALLQQERSRLDGLIALVDRTLENSQKGDAEMDFAPFDKTEIEKTKQQYADEAKERWGDTDAWRESSRREAGRTDAQRRQLGEESDALMRAFAEKRTLPPDGPEAHALVQRWQAYITENFYPCTPQILAGLGQMYTGDERFRRSIDRFGEGTAAFMSAAIEAYCR